jgi:ribosomal protein S18 acetylase RimI-like enzyme
VKTTTIAIRTATAVDAPSIAKVHAASWSVAYRTQIDQALLAGLDVAERSRFWGDRILEAPGSTLVAERRSRIIGFCHVMPSRDPGIDPVTVVELSALYVSPHNWRCGIGRALCTTALTTATAQQRSCITLWVLASNAPAIRFYEAMRFLADGDTSADSEGARSGLQEIRMSRKLP